MKLTPAFKAWLSANCKVAADASDEVFRKAAGVALGDGTLTVEKMTELTAKSDAPASPLEMLVKTLSGFNDRLAMIESKACDDEKKKKKGKTEEMKSDEDETDTDVADTATEKIIGSIVEKTANSIFGAMARQGFGGASASGHASSVSDTATPVKLFTMSGEEGSQAPADARIRIKGAIEGYDRTRKTATYATDCKHAHLRGMPVHTGENGRTMETSSQLDKAITGAWFKFTVNSACRAAGKSVPRCYKMTEHDHALVQYALHEVPFTGIAHADNEGGGKFTLTGHKKMSDLEIKAVLDDSVSGGLEAAPIVFDDALILFPLLFGEIFPLVNTVNLTRGRRVEGFSMNNPTISSGIAEGTEIPLFDTASFIAAFDTTIYNAVGAMEIGKDFEDDSPVNIGEQIVAKYGEAMLEWLDRVVAVGDGLVEPEGVFTASGTVAVTSDNSTSGPPTLSDYEGLLFGVTKVYRQPQDKARCVYMTNETTYRRSRGMKVDPQATGRDERRLLGLDHENYMTLGHPHKINEHITNGKAAFANLRRYRMYRRLGMQVAIESGGRDLVRRNMSMIVVRARFGGQLEDGNAASVCTSMQS